MSIRHAILGFLSWKPFTGYELKKLFSDALTFHWSGNNNQIYGTLVGLHRDGAVSIEVQQQEKFPARKLYSITAKGRDELRAWLLSEPELPALRSMAHIQLAWADCLSAAELDALLDSYERQLEAQVLMCREAARRRAAGGAGHEAARGAAGDAVRDGSSPARSAREALIWTSIDENNLAFYDRELEWTRRLRAAAAALERP